MDRNSAVTVCVYDIQGNLLIRMVTDIGTSFYINDITDGFDVGRSAESIVDPNDNVTIEVCGRVGRLTSDTPDSNKPTLPCSFPSQ